MMGTQAEQVVNYLKAQEPLGGWRGCRLTGPSTIPGPPSCCPGPLAPMLRGWLHLYPGYVSAYLEHTSQSPYLPGSFDQEDI